MVHIIFTTLEGIPIKKHNMIKADLLLICLIVPFDKLGRFSPKKM